MHYSKSDTSCGIKADAPQHDNGLFERLCLER